MTDSLHALDPALSTTEVQRRVTSLQNRQASIADSHLDAPRDDNILQDENIATDRAQVWNGLDRFGFNALLASSGYKNKLRLQPHKEARIIYFLTTPDAKSREKDRSDAQAKHQSQQWMYQDSVLYRRESRLQQPRRHVGADEAFDILTAEHLKSGHQGRDKMLKILETKYIGYTKDELMFVLTRCSVCSGKNVRGAVMRRRANKDGSTLKATSVSVAENVDPQL